MPSRPIPLPTNGLIISLGVLSFSCLSAGFIASRRAPAAMAIPAKQNFEILTATKEGALRLKKEYTLEGFHASVYSVKSRVKVPSGFIVARDLAPVAAKFAGNALAHVYHYKVSLTKKSGDDVEVRVGETYRTKKEAKSLAAKLQSLGYNWQVKQNYMDAFQQKYQVELSGVPGEKAKQIEKSIAEKGLKAIITQSL